MPSRLGHIHAESVASSRVHTDDLDVKNLTVKQSMNLASDLSTSGSITSTGSISAEEVHTTTLKIGGATPDFSSFLTSVSYADVQQKPTYLVDWSVDQGDTNIDSNNIPLLNYAANTLASNGTAGLSNFNFNDTRKNKLANIEDYAQVNVQSNWDENDTTKDSFIQNKPDLAGKQNTITLQNNVIDLTDTTQIGSLSFGTGVNANKLIYTPATPPVIPTYSAGTGISLNGTTFSNTAPDQTVVLNNGNNVTVNGTYPNFTISSTYTETDPVFIAHTTSNISNGSGFLRNNGSGTWTYDNSTYITAAQAPLDTPVVATASGTGNLTISSGSGYNNLLTYTPPDTVNNATNATYATMLSGGHKIVSVNAPPLGMGASGVPYLYSTAGLGYVPVNNVHVYFADNADKCPIVTGFGINNTNQTIVNTTTNQTIGGTKTFSSNATFPSLTLTLPNSATQYIARIGAFGITVNYLTVYNGFTNYSDDRIKSNEKLISNGTSIIEQLKPKTYDKHVDYRVPADKEDNDLSGIDCIKESGFVAQEVDTIADLKHLVSYDKSKDLYSLNYIGMIPYLVKAIQELEARIKTLEGE